MLAPGDIVAFRFPCSGRGPHEEPKVRPCLVLEIRESGGRRFVEIAYGTSADTEANRGLDIEVADDTAVAAAGLDRPTRFVGARRTMVSTDHSGFDISEGVGSPIIGRLTGKPEERMNAVRARVQAERDRVAERRGRATVRRTVIVEHRPARNRARQASSSAIAGEPQGE